MINRISLVRKAAALALSGCWLDSGCPLPVGQKIRTEMGPLGCIETSGPELALSLWMGKKDPVVFF